MISLISWGTAGISFSWAFQVLVVVAAVVIAVAVVVFVIVVIVVVVVSCSILDSINPLYGSQKDKDQNSGHTN